MGLRERILKPLDRRQLIVFAAVLSFSLITSIVAELYYYRSYQFNFMHLAVFGALVALFFNPQGIRLLFFIFFTGLLFHLFTFPMNNANIYYNFNTLLIAQPIHHLGSSLQINAYVHLGLYTALAYFSFRNPFEKSANRSEKKELDQL